MEWSQKAGMVQGRTWGFKTHSQGFISLPVAFVFFHVLPFCSDRNFPCQTKYIYEMFPACITRAPVSLGHMPGPGAIT